MRSRGSIPIRDRNLFSSAQVGSEAHPASYPMGTDVSLRGGVKLINIHLMVRLRILEFFLDSPLVCIT
jgi:hypothetical protein